MSKYTAANWNKNEDDFTQTIFQQLRSQIWFSEEISLIGDLPVWNTLPKKVQDAYVRNLGMLTFLDTHQGNEGMNIIGRSLSDDFHQRKATLSFIEMTENAIHAKSYSSIFTTYLPLNEEINEVFKWCEDNESLQAICDIIISIYKNLDKNVYLKEYGSPTETVTEEEFKIAQWKAMVASTFLETYLFYSGFYYPLWFYGQGKLMQSGEIINLILRDESIHGLYIGILSQEIYQTFNDELKEEMHNWAIKLLELLYKNQTQLIEDLYSEVGLTHDVKIFVRYNANKALLNVGFDEYFEEEEVNPIVLNGLNTKTKTMDFFSMKGNGYQSMVSESLSDNDFEELFAFDNLVIPESQKEENIWIRDEESIIQLLKDSILDADIYSASKLKDIENKFLENTIKVLKRYYGDSLNTANVLDFITEDNEFIENSRIDILFDLYNSDSEDAVENGEIVKWLIDYFNLNDHYDFVDDETDNDSLSEFEQTSSYRRLLVSILREI